MGNQWWMRGLALLGLIVGVGIVAAIAFQAGAAQQAGVVAASGGAPMPPGGPYGYGPHAHWGGGFFGGFFVFRILFGVLFVFLLFRLLRFAIFGPQHWGPRGMGWQGGPGMMGGPGGPRWERRRAMLEDWHRTAHEAPDAAASPSTARATTESDAADEPRT